MKNAAGILIFALFSMVGFWPKLTIAEESHPGIGIESLYSEAVLAYNRKQTDEVLRILDELLTADPKHVEALELKALSLKEKGDDPKSLETYQKLIELKPQNERGPYYFEAGTILNRQKKLREARVNFEQAIKLNFNVESSALYLGLITFNISDLNAAEYYFRRVLRTADKTETGVIAHYYLGLIYFKKQNGGAATTQLVYARDQARNLPDSKLAKDIQGASEKILEPFSKSQWFGNLSVLIQYDTNVSQVPSSSPNPALATGAATPKVTVFGGVGYITSSVEPIQWVPSYRVNLNKNLNSDARTYEFITNTFSSYFNYKPLLQNSGGFKLEGNYTFENLLNNPSDATSGYAYQQYSITGEFGPFYHFNLSPTVRMDLEAYWRPEKYYDPNTGQSGNSGYMKVSARADNSSKYWNPGADLNFERNLTDSDAFKYTALGAGIYDIMRIDAKNTLTWSIDYSNNNYTQSATTASAQRIDQLITPALAWVRLLNAHWAILGNMTFTDSFSTLDAYTYKRFVVGGGANYTF